MIKPYGTYLFIKPVEKPQVLVSDDGTFNEYGVVVAVGDECTGKIKVGDKVGFSVFGIEKLIIDDQKYYFLKESDEFLLCTIEE